MNHELSNWYIDDRCVNCDVARQLAPSLIAQVAGESQVIRQPRTVGETETLYAAAFACPTRSIRPPTGRLIPTRDPFPLRLDEDLYLCGHNSIHTAGANAYLLRRATTTFMIDTPRWSDSLATRYAERGQVTDILLT